MNKELLDYIRNVQSQGYDKATITKHLLDHGYPKDLVDNAFSELAVEIKPKKQKKKLPTSLFIGIGVVAVLIIIVGAAYLFWPEESVLCEQTDLDIYSLNEGLVLCVYPDQSKVQYILENNGEREVKSVLVEIETESGTIKDELSNVDIGSEDVFTYISNIEEPSPVQSVSFTPIIDEEGDDAVCKSKMLVFTDIKLC